MANQYANSQAMLDVLKELYGPQLEAEEDKAWREFLNKDNKLKGLPEIKFKSYNHFNDLIFGQNPFLKLIPKDEGFKGTYVMPLSNDKQNE